MRKYSLPMVGILGFAVLAAGGVPAESARALQTVLAADDGGVAGPAAEFQPEPIEWSACTNFLKDLGGQCGFLEVPLDYARPDDVKIKIAVSRISHKSSESAYQGVGLINLSIAGVPGLTQSAAGSYLGEIGSTYDWIGFDPRGVGASQPKISCDKTYWAYGRPAYVPRKKDTAQAWLDRSKGYAQACAEAGSPLLPHMRSINTVLDMESLRKALGQRQLTYYGFNYGSYLGQLYATRYPERVRRMVLDGPVDPARVWYEATTLDQSDALDVNIQKFYRWVAANDSVFHLGATRGAVQRKYESQLRQLAKQPAGGTIGPTELTDVFLLASYYLDYWNPVAKAFAAWLNKGDAAPLKALFEETAPAGQDGIFAAGLAVLCTDAAWPRNWATWNADTRSKQRTAPFSAWANVWYVAPCAFWPVAPGKPEKVDGSKAPPILLIVDTTVAPATSYDGALAVRSLFPSASLVESGQVKRPGAVDGGNCTTLSAVASYLGNGTLPSRVQGSTSDVSCPALSLPTAAP